jgi:hypothetical protein
MSPSCCKSSAVIEAGGMLMVPDPFATIPEYWEEEEDGAWSPPLVALSDLPSWCVKNYLTWRQRFSCCFHRALTHLHFAAALPNISRVLRASTGSLVLKVSLPF